jgi:hypothetical protein
MEQSDASRLFAAKQKLFSTETVAPKSSDADGEIREILQLMYTYMKKNQAELMARIDDLEQKLESLNAVE